eukprot:6180772-Pleurochrysis_carterae.AAC.5
MHLIPVCCPTSLTFSPFRYPEKRWCPFCSRFFAPTPTLAGSDTPHFFPNEAHSVLRAAAERLASELGLEQLQVPKGARTRRTRTRERTRTRKRTRGCTRARTHTRPAQMRVQALNMKRVCSREPVLPHASACARGTQCPQRKR